MLTRIYGTAYATKDELKEHLEQMEEAKRRDHNKLGREMKTLHNCRCDRTGTSAYHAKRCDHDAGASALDRG